MKRPSRGLRESASTMLVERALLGAAAGQSDLQRHENSSRQSKIDERNRPQRPATGLCRRAGGISAAQAVAHQALLAHLADLLHHVGHLLVLLQQLVDVLHRDAGAGGDALLAAGLDEVRVLAFALGHRPDDGLLALDRLGVDLGVLRAASCILPMPGSMPMMPLRSPIFSIWRNCEA